MVFMTVSPILKVNFSFHQLVEPPPSKSTAYRKKSGHLNIGQGKGARLAAVDVGETVFGRECCGNECLSAAARHFRVARQSRHGAADEFGALRVAQIEELRGEYQLGAHQAWVERYHCHAVRTKFVGCIEREFISRRFR